jgi:quercetin dioxygenase-like cupin family protein
VKWSNAVSAVMTFALGACAGAAVSTGAGEPPAPAPAAPAAPAPAGGGDAAGPAASVVALAEAERRSPPGSPASIALLARGDRAFLGLLRLPGGGAVPEHQDASEEYIYVLEGSGTLTIDGTEYELSPGSAVFMPSGATVTYTNGDEELVALQVFAGPESAAKYDRWEPAG